VTTERIIACEKKLPYTFLGAGTQCTSVEKSESINVNEKAIQKKKTIAI
jgi:hypothetical protein